MEPDTLKKEKPNFNSPENFFNRELSLIEFNKRVLAEAEDESHPLLERLKFISIVSSNLDEFFMIRVAGLKDQITAGVAELSFDGMTPQEQLKEIRKRLLPLYAHQEYILMKEILPALDKEEIIIHFYDTLSIDEKKILKNYFFDSVFPLLTPLSLDPGHPFPRIVNRSLNIVFVLNDRSKRNPEKRVAILQLPSVLPRLVKIERQSGYHFVLLEQIIQAYSEELFPGLSIELSNTFRIIRDADIEIAEDEAEDLMIEIAEQVRHRRWETATVYLEVSTNMPEFLVKLLMKSLEIEPDDVYIHSRPLKLIDFMELAKIDIRHLRDIPFQTRILPELRSNDVNIFEVLNKKDLLVHHPYDSYTNSVLKFIDSASIDPNVLAIKITLYRTGMNSFVVEALKRAAENGKEVTAFVELKARFDEEYNIIWAKELEHVGVHVIYGVLGLKTHCKIAMVVRREGTILKTYIHMSTGNYNQVTARIYTDLGLFTAREEFIKDSIHLFNFLTGYSNQKEWKHLIVAPINLRQKILQLIVRETEKHTEQKPGLIYAKMNALSHSEVITALYRASQKGVKVKLLVRGVCCLKPGIPGISENIEVRSIIGRFLEHSRIFYFKNGGEEEYFLSSADWMTRNLQHRVELMFPIYDPAHQNKLMELLNIYWKDNLKSYVLNSDGSYSKVNRKEKESTLCAQDFLLNEIKNLKRKNTLKS